jgi:phosphohistidine phosphatase
MKTLYLLRHAKSSWAEHGLSDQQRPLNERGLRDAPMMGKRFRSRGESFQRIVASPALRAQQTAGLFAEACGFATDDIETDSNLYFLGSGSIEDLIQSQDEQVNSLMLVFHNPDITWFANAIDDDVRIDNVPTCGLIRLSCDLTGWSDWTRAQTSFEYFDYPKNLSNQVISR